MRWSIVGVIWARELRDQLRDRRTLLMIAVLPLLLYPLLGAGLGVVAGNFAEAPQVVGVCGIENLPRFAPGPAVAWLSAAPCPAVPLAGAERAAAAAALDLAAQADPRDAYPPLLVEGPDGWQAAPAYLDPDNPKPLEIRPLATDPADPDATRAVLERRDVDLVVVVPPDFSRKLGDGERPALLLLSREGDDFSRAVNDRFTILLSRWRKAITKVRLARRGLPADFDEPFRVDDPERDRPDAKRAAADLFRMLLRVFPFVLVMWSMAGALYPAVDLCAGEKERGTMETLLITPASREEIVWGKFLTIWVFSAATALLNLLSIGATTWLLSSRMPNDAFHPAVLLWGVLLALPLSALFSAVCLAVGAYARSSKEGQYYLMPLFLGTLPLVFLTLLPGVELNGFYCLVPVTGAALLLQQLITPTPGASPWPYFLPVLAATTLYGWIALRWAVAQFQSEEVLFREAERLDLGLWLRRLFRGKAAGAARSAPPNPVNDGKKP